MTGDTASETVIRFNATCTPIVEDAVFVLGMHRSGTSALAGALERFGLAFGAVNRTHNPHNAFGNYENGAVIALDRAVLGPPGATEAIPPGAEIDKAVHEILLSYPRQRIGIKEPNLLFTLALWAVHTRSVSLVGTLRHPLNVASSLDARARAEHRDTDNSEQLEAWRQFNERLLEIRRSIAFPIIDFDEAPAMYLKQLAAVAAALGLRYDEAAAQQFISPPLVHHRGGGPVPSELDELYRELKQHSTQRVTAECLPGTEVVRRIGLTVSRPEMRAATPDVSTAWRDAQLAVVRLLLAVAVRDAEIRRLQSRLDTPRS